MLVFIIGSVFPSMRTDLGFGATFFIFRICYHAYIFAYAIYSQVYTPIIIMYALTLILHINWFYTWMIKYGFKGKKTNKTVEMKSK
jgi:hypothetical protein